MTRAPKVVIDRATPSPWLMFKNQAVRDLGWLLFSPRFNVRTSTNLHQHPLFHATNTAKHLEWLKTLDNQTTWPLPSQRLGQYFEYLLAFYFEEGYHAGLHRLQIHSHNLQIIKDKKTLGELDFILRNEDGQFIHIEACVKFYLCRNIIATNSKESDWVGVQTRDRLDIKIDRTLTHQLPIVKTQEATEILTKKKVDTEQLSQAVLFSGGLYQKIHHNEPPPAQALSLKTFEGVSEYRFWLYQKELRQFLEAWAPSRTLINTKDQWMTGCHLSTQPFLEDINDILNKVKLRLQSRWPCHIQCQKEHSEHAIFIMVVNDYWGDEI